ncbi:MAG TPA: lysophospholipid acyltransferase family protein [Syntrophales bacterium]|nr:1-acyl-sn-glycerol-3-phosphate acyltransferase [Syntrophobacterales bacterium]HRR39645.1 lysophospholipid acyltransferase family protein [Syntrophales bacterium]HRT70054.1 lysophospholipid acyltransferase family protein [Syntrophales bacterium]
MIDIERLEKVRLVRKPLGQRIIGALLLTVNYRVFADVDIRIENIERIPKDETVIFAMNHTDRYNYWPFQWKLWRKKCFPFTTVWVKGKYYRNALLGKFLDWCNLIPVPSMGYLVEEFYRKRFKRRIEKEEYRVIKDLIDGKQRLSEALKKLTPETAAMLKDDFVEHVRNYHEILMTRVAELSCKALLEKNLNLIIFPEGTRSLKLGEGKTGLAQLALHTEKAVVPVGCNNSDLVYRGHLPFARSGRITYRVGEPLSFNGQLKDYRIREGFKLFSRESQRRYREQFEAVTRIVMDCINRNVDERYRK